MIIFKFAKFVPFWNVSVYPQNLFELKCLSLCLHCHGWRKFWESTLWNPLIWTLFLNYRLIYISQTDRQNDKLTDRHTDSCTFTEKLTERHSESLTYISQTDRNTARQTDRLTHEPTHSGPTGLCFRDRLEKKSNSVFLWQTMRHRYFSTFT